MQALLAFTFYCIVKFFLALCVVILGALVIGILRLFIWGPSQRYSESITNLALLQKGDILLMGKQSVAHSWYIQISNVLTRKLKHRFWTHAALYQGTGKVWEAQPEGVIEKDIQEYFHGGFYIRAFRHRYIQEERVLDQVIRFCEDKKGYKYGMAGTIFFTLSSFVPVSFNWIFDNSWLDQWLSLDQAYFCSELVVDAFCAAGFPVSPYDGWRVKPTDFISNPALLPV